MLIAAGLLTKTAEPVLGVMKPKAELSHYRHFALLPSCAQTFVEKLGIDFSKDRTLIADCCPGGLVTQALKEVGADKVVALQKFKQDVITFKVCVVQFFVVVAVITTQSEYGRCVRNCTYPEVDGTGHSFEMAFKDTEFGGTIPNCKFLSEDVAGCTFSSRHINRATTIDD
uniref:Uncharacterized protein n=1 Tax=Eptatretus burgeri TaxID=7764 RepID=A0A8C4Q5N0_EPTBU